MAENDIEPDPPSEHELTQWANELGHLSSNADNRDIVGNQGPGAFEPETTDDRFGALPEEEAGASDNHRFIENSHDNQGEGNNEGGWAGGSSRQYNGRWDGAVDNHQRNGDNARSGQYWGGGNSRHEGQQDDGGVNPDDDAGET